MSFYFQKMVTEDNSAVVFKIWAIFQRILYYYQLQNPKTSCPRKDSNHIQEAGKRVFDVFVAL